MTRMRGTIKSAKWDSGKQNSVQEEGLCEEPQLNCKGHRETNATGEAVRCNAVEDSIFCAALVAPLHIAPLRFTTCLPSPPPLSLLSSPCHQSTRPDQDRALTRSGGGPKASVPATAPGIAARTACVPAPPCRPPTASRRAPFNAHRLSLLPRLAPNSACRLSARLAATTSRARSLLQTNNAEGTPTRARPGIYLFCLCKFQFLLFCGRAIG